MSLVGVTGDAPAVMICSYCTQPTRDGYISGSTGVEVNLGVGLGSGVGGMAGVLVGSVKATGGSAGASLVGSVVASVIASASGSSDDHKNHDEQAHAISNTMLTISMPVKLLLLPGVLDSIISPLGSIFSTFSMI